MAHAIEFKDVDKWFGPLHVLGGVNLDVEAGEVIVVCGPSGSGKSTLIRCVNRLEPIQKGDIRVYGESITGPGVNLARQTLGPELGVARLDVGKPPIHRRKRLVLLGVRDQPVQLRAVELVLEIRSPPSDVGIGHQSILSRSRPPALGCLGSSCTRSTSRRARWD